MAQSYYNINLTDATFPMLSEQQTRTVMGQERGKAPSDNDRIGIAYCHNVMPSKRGLNSISFLPVISALPSLPFGAAFSDTRVIFGSERSRVDLAWDTQGNIYALLEGSTAWISLPATIPNTLSPTFTTESVTIGTVNGVSHIFYSTIGSFTYNETTNQLDAETLTGLNISTILGVVASSGYLVAYTENAIAWSSTIDPTDFIPSAVTGSGGGNVAGTKGKILFIVANTLGLVVYTGANTLAGTYTGNVQFPFKFREVENSEGGISLDRTAYEANSSSQFVYSKAGLQTLNSRAAETILPEVTDFLAGRKFEDFDEVTKLYQITDLTPAQTMLKKIKFIASRYLVISYGITSFTHALVFDTSLKRLGKLKIAHVDCFEYIGAQTEISKETIAFLLPTGEVKILDFSSPAVSTGVLILGKLQFSRTRLITLLGVEVEGSSGKLDVTISTQASLDGKTFTNVEGTVAASEANYVETVFKNTAKNHSIVLIGNFDAVTGLVRYTIAGKR